MGVEIGLIALFLILVLFVFDTSNVTGLIYVGITAIIIVPIVIVLEKKREKLAAEGEEGNGEETISSPQEEVKPGIATGEKKKPLEIVPAVKKPSSKKEPESQEQAVEPRVKNNEYKWRKKKV